MPDNLFYRLFKHLIPKGIYYEHSKTRWRVRLYREGTVVFLSYFKTFEEAIKHYTKAKNIQRTATSTKIENLEINTSNTINLIITLGLLP